MTKRALTALKKSIKHWEEMAKNGWENEKPEGENCALCVEFSIGLAYDKRCLKCPVKLKTGLVECCGTPFYEASKAFMFDELDTFKYHAQLEVEFLKSLLPVKEEMK